MGNKQKQNVASSDTGSNDKGNKLLGLDGQVTLYIGGTECQPFSKMGCNKGRKDDRADTMQDAIAFVSKRRPKVFILEQMKNITSKTHKDFLKEKVIRKLRGVKQFDKKDKAKQLYRIHQQHLNSLDFGIPQVRKRLYIIGVRKDERWLRKFRMPQKGVHKPISLSQLLQGTIVPQIPDKDLSYTEQRNWDAIQKEMHPRLETIRFPVFADFHASAAYGI